MSERIVFAEESIHERRVWVKVEGFLDESLLDALASFIERQRKILVKIDPPPQQEGENEPL